MDTSEETEVGFLFTSGFKHVLGSEVGDEETSDGTVNLELLAEDGSGDAKNFWDFGAEFLVSLLIEEDFVIQLVLDLDLSP